ncbi:MAG TPA: hypothetical protein DEQ47_08820 [Solibacterales bacterium]|nr:hypothetical protein [Bryobacterales bacterium]
MSRISLFFSLILSIVSGAAAATRPELYGTWQLQTATSKWGVESAAITSGTLTITKHHKTIHMAVSVVFDHGDRTDEMDWRVDDRYHPISGPASGEIMAKWDGATLVGEREQPTGHESYRLTTSEGGSTLTERVHHTGPDGAWDRLLIWSKK